jgi:hypothetical protein
MLKSGRTQKAQVGRHDESTSYPLKMHVHPIQAINWATSERPVALDGYWTVLLSNKLTASAITQVWKWKGFPKVQSSQ